MKNFYKKLILSFLAIVVLPFNSKAQYRTDLFQTDRETETVVGAIGGYGGAGGLGGATYSIPIRVPEGLGGLQPSLSVSYNSQGSNGLLGWCWDLQGLSSITRTGTTQYHDGNTSGVDFYDDRFSLDGQRLICVSGIYGANNAEYRTETDGMAKIVSYTCDTTTGPAYFKVWLPNGSIAYYGNSRDSRIGLQQSNDVCLWLLNRVEDRNGNYMDYHYIKGGDNYALHYINYGGNSISNIPNCYLVRFIYSFRNDSETSFIGDNSIRQVRRLDTIKVIHENNVLYKYWFNYSNPRFQSGYYYTRLTQINFNCGDETYNPTIIQWGNNDYQYYGGSQCQSIDVTGGNCSDFDGKIKFPGDFNGDGYTDVLLYYPNLNGGKAAAFYINDGVSNNRLFFSKQTNYIVLNNNIDWIYTPDINGDGLDDIILSNRERTIIGKDKLTITAYLSSVAADGTYSFSQIPQNFGEFKIKKKYKETILVGDFLGEGKQSFLLQECEDNKALPRLFYITYSNGTLSAQQLPQSMVLDADKMFACDFNGDGISEIYFMNEDEVTTGLLRMRHSGSSYFYETVNSNMLSPWHQVFPGDFNGDGKPDLLSYVEDGNGNGSWHLHYFKESRLQWPSLDISTQVIGVGNPGTHGYSLKYCNDPDYKFITVGDFNGDGKADVAVRTENEQMKYLYGPIRNENGQGQFASSQTVSLNTIGMANVSNQTICTGNFLGHENLSIFSAFTLHALNPISNRYSIIRVTDGMGNCTEFEYDYLMPKPSGASNTDFYIKTPQTGLEQLNEMYTISLPMKGMSNMSTYNIHCQPTTKVSYRYKNAFIQKRGRGFLGFKSITSENWLSGSKQQSVERNFETVFRVPSLALQTETVRSGNDLLLAVTENDNDLLLRRDPLVGTIQKIFVPVVRKQMGRNYDIDHPGSLLTKTITEYLYNDTVINLPGGVQIGTYSLLKQTDVLQGVDSSNNVSTASACEFQTLTHTNYYSETSSNLQGWIVNRPRSVLTTSRLLGCYDDICSLTVYHYLNGQDGGSYLPSCVIHYPSGIEDPYDPLATYDSTFYSSEGFVKVKKAGDLASTLPQKIQQFDYSPDGRFIVMKTNSIGHTITYNYHPDYGYLISEIDGNGLQISYKASPIGTWLATYPYLDQEFIDETLWVANNDSFAPEGAYYYEKRSYLIDDREKRIYFDASGKKLRTVSCGMYSELIFKDFAYNNKGLLIAESLPYFNGADTVYWTHYGYDNFNRLNYTEHPNGLDEVVLFDGFRTLYLKYLDDPDNPVFTSTTINAAGWTVKCTDENENEVRYNYYADGKLMTAQLGSDSSTAINIEYDDAGNRITLADPNYGTVRNTYNAYGQLVSTTTPSAVITTYQYDVLGNMVKRYEYNSLNKSIDSTLWIYSNNPGTKGLLSQIQFNETKQSITYAYDTLNRVSSVTEQRGSDIFSTHYTYDYASRVTTITYPSEFVMRKHYTNTGILDTLYENSSNTLLWVTESKNAFGQVTRYHTGDGVSTERNYDPLSGRLMGIVSWKGNDTLQNLSYVFDKNANLASRKDNLRNMEECFTYDPLNRLTYIIEDCDTTGVFAYDDYGRMTMKRIHGAMVFDNTLYGAEGRPHALERARMYAEMPEQNLKYTSFDKISSITQDDIMVPTYRQLGFDYGYEHQRLCMTETSVQDTIVKDYVGNCEFVRQNRIPVSERTYLNGPLGVFAVLDSHILPIGKGMYYVHPDHLGSWTTVTDRIGVVVQDVRFDPWGTPYYSDSTTLTPASSLLFDRGFTGHEHIMNFGLINMNGRVYDPMTSTFLSVDNYVQDPTYTQNFNRYAYCMNNPLKYTDPDGEWAHLVIGALIGGIVNLATNWNSINTFGEGLAYFGIGATAGVVGAATGGAAAGAMKLGGFVSGAVSGAAGGASSGFITGSGNAWMQGANFGQGLKAGAIAGGIGAGTGALFGGLTRGFVDYRKGYSFWEGKRIDEFIDGSISSAWDDCTNQYNSSQKAEYETELLKERINEDFGVTEGEYNIDKITTRSSGKYRITSTGKYINPETNNVIGGYCEQTTSGYSELHISSHTTLSNDIHFKAVTGHELIHAYHHYTIPNASYNRTYSERVAYQYTREVYLNNGCLTDALKVMYKAMSLNYWGNAPMNYYYHPF